MKAFAFALALLGGITSTIAADDSLISMPGYVDFAELSQEYGEPRVMINIGGSLLKLVGSMKHDDPVAEEALRNLESVRVHVYSTAGNTMPAAARMEQASDKLATLDWEQIVRVREPDELVNVYVKHSGNSIQGLVVMAVDSEEAVFVNILGDIDPSQLNQVVSRIDVVNALDIDLAP